MKTINLGENLQFETGRNNVETITTKLESLLHQYLSNHRNDRDNMAHRIRELANDYKHLTGRDYVSRGVYGR